MMTIFIKNTIKKNVWNKGLIGATSPNKTSFKKGDNPWNKNIKGIHLSPNTEFKKGQEPWNKGKEFIKLRGKNHHNSKTVLQYFANGDFIAKFDSGGEAARSIGGDNSKLMTCARGDRKTYKGYVWKIEKNNEN